MIYISTLFPSSIDIISNDTKNAKGDKHDLAFLNYCKFPTYTYNTREQIDFTHSI
jgi:hypothetical protein